MAIFILILAVTSGGGRPAITTQEFSREERCQVALAEFTKVWGSYGSYGVCVPK